MFCPQCGTRYADGAKFCPGCGKQLPQTKPTLTIQTNTPVPASTPKPMAAQAATKQSTLRPATVHEAAKTSARARSTAPASSIDFPWMRALLTVLEVLIVVCFFQPWYLLDYYYGSYECSLFSLGTALSDYSSSYSSVMSMFGASATNSVSQTATALSAVFFVVGATPVALLAWDVIRLCTGGKHERTGITSALVVVALGALALFFLKAYIANELSGYLGSSMGNSVSSVFKLAWGWYATLALVIVEYAVERWASAK